MAPASERVEFENGRGQTLAGRLELPDSPRGFALFAHCFTCSKDIAAASRIARALARTGLGVLRFDFTGLGNSEGDFGNESFSSNVDDLLAAADWLREHHAAPVLLVGHSLGGAAVLSVGSRIEEVRAVATIGAPSDPEHVAHLLDDDLDAIEADGEAQVTLGGRSFTIRKQFVEDLRKQPFHARLGGLRAAKLILHAPGDEIVSIEEAGKLFQRLIHPKSFVAIDESDHLLSKREDALWVADVLASWASRYVGGGTASVAETSSGGERPDIDDDEVLVREREKLTQDVYIGTRHHFVADEPEDLGGDDRGPAPYEILASALGVCTSMTVRMYANHKKWPLRGISVRLHHEKIDGGKDEDGKPRKIDTMTRRLSFAGDLDQEQRERLVEIAGRCPVHRTLEGEVRIETELED